MKRLKIFNWFVTCAHYVADFYNYYGVNQVARKGDEEALYHLGCLYENGSRYVKKDIVAAYCFFILSANKDFAKAKNKVNVLTTELSEFGLDLVKERMQYYMERYQ